MWWKVILFFLAASVLAARDFREFVQLVPGMLILGGLVFILLYFVLKAAREIWANRWKTPTDVYLIYLLLAGVVVFLVGGEIYGYEAEKLLIGAMILFPFAFIFFGPLIAFVLGASAGVFAGVFDIYDANKKTTARAGEGKPRPYLTPDP